jgi:hypothetical protein
MWWNINIAFFILVYCTILHFANNLLSNDQKNLKHSLFDLSWWNESNSSSFMFLYTIDGKIYDKM